ncbi:hypothetical protein PM082_013586 [Marasmius tenuissimus]|nr:hypothetical protein PM082_013586 [Marasmius tenuissimus]
MATALAVLIVFILLSLTRKHSKLPPGPPSYPLVGNLLSIPGTQKPRKLRDMAGLYGDITFFHGLGQRILIINNRRAMSEIIIKRCDVSSGRPVLTMCGELVGYTKSVVLKQPGHEFREMRREINLAVGKAGAAKRNLLFDSRFLGMYLQKLHTNPNKLFEHNRWLLGAFTLGFAYGYKPKDYGDALVEDAGRAIAEFSDLVEPGMWIVDSFPFLKHILMRVPNFKRRVQQFQDSQKALSITPYNMVKGQLRNGTAPPSFCADLIQTTGDRDVDSDREAFIAWTVGNI